MADMDVKTARQRDIQGIDTAMAMGNEAGRNISLHEGIEGKTDEQMTLKLS
jgi:hypothetical protein